MGCLVGWLAPPAALVAPMTIAVSAQVNNLPLFIQRAAEAALTGPQACVSTMAAAYRERRDLAVALLRQRGVQDYVPAGAFYLLIRVGRAEDGFDGVAFAEALIRERGIAVAPGAAFGQRTSGYGRGALASSPESLRCGIEGLLDSAGA